MATTSVVAIGSVLLTGLALRYGWLGPDIGRGETFCEVGRAGLVKQPANTWSNLGFVLAGLLIAWRADRPERLGEVITRWRWLPTVYACLVVLLGPCSAAMHASQSAWGGHLDMLSMYLVASFAASYALIRWLRRGPVLFFGLFLGFLVACEIAGSWSRPIPVVMFAGNLAFGTLLVSALVIELLIHLRGETSARLVLGVAAAATMLVSFGIWQVSKQVWCDPTSLLQGHAVWHVLDAAAAYLLFCYYASERSGVSARR